MSKLQIIPVSIHGIRTTIDMNLTDVVQNRCEDSFNVIASFDPFMYQDSKHLIFEDVCSQQSEARISTMQRTASIRSGKNVLFVMLGMC